MPFFKVNPYCDYLDVIEGTASCRAVYPAGSIIELSDINVGNQANRLTPINEEESKAMDDSIPKIETRKVEDANPLLSMADDIEARRKSAKEKLSAMAGKSK